MTKYELIFIIFLAIKLGDGFSINIDIFLDVGAVLELLMQAVSSLLYDIH